MRMRTTPYSKVLRLSPGRIALGYAALALLWIAFSDAVVTRLRLHPAVMTIKGGVFVLVTATLLYFTVRRLVQVVQLTSQERDETAKRAAEALRESERKYHELVEHANSIILHWQRDGRIIRLNEFGQRFFGYTESEVCGRHVMGTIVPESDSSGRELNTLLEQIAADPSAFEQNVNENMRRNGQRVWIAWTNKVQRNSQGEVTEILSIGLDITARKEAEQKVRESEQRYRRIVDTASEGIWELDEHYTTTLVNRRMAEMLGYEPQEMTGRRFEEFLFEGDLADHQTRVAARHQGVAEGFERRFRRKDGSTVWMQVSATPILDAEHRFLGSFAMMTDITERKQAEEALRRLNRELRAISNCNQVLLHATDEQSLLQEVCRIVCEEAGYRVAWVGYAEHDEAKSVRLVALTGAEKEALANLGITWADTERGRGPCGTAIRTGETSCIEDYATDLRGAPWKEVALRHGFRSAIGLPLKDEQASTFGCLNIYSAQPNAFASEEVRLLEELAGDLAFGIVALRSRAARGRAEQEVALLSFALDRVRDAAFLIDEQGRCQYANESASRILGYNRAEVLGMCVADLDPDFPPERWPGHWRELKERQTLRLESRHRTREGRVFPVEVCANYFEYEGRGYNLALVRDITERKRAEEERRESAERFRAIADYTYDWENWIGVDGKLLWVNPAVERITGHSVGECMAMPDFPVPIVAEADREALARQMGEAVQGSSRNDFEFRVRHKDGQLVWVAASWQPIYDSRGVRLGHRSSMRDITERKRAEGALRRSEAYLTEAQRLSHTGSWAFDVAGNKYTYTSEECLRIFELDAQQGLPTREAVSRLIRPEDWDAVNAGFEKSVREKIDTSAEFRITLPSGTVKHIQVTRHPILNDAGDVVELVGTTIDMTERKQAELALQESEANLNRAQEIAHIGSWHLDIAHNQLAWSNEVFHMFALPRGTPLTYEAFLDRVYPEDRERVDRAWGAALQRAPYDIEHRILVGDELKWVRERAVVEFDPQGKAVKGTGTVQDITERKQAEEELRKHREHLEDLVKQRTEELAEAKARAEAASRSKTTFLANISHELRTPLNAVLGFSRLLKSGPDVTPRQQEALEIVVRSGEHLLNLINNVLDMAKIESGRMVLEESEVDLHQLLHEMQSLLGVGATEKGLHFTLESAPDLPRFVAVDAGKLRQVLLNLVGNAIKYTESGGVKLRATVVGRGGAETAQVRFEVEDSGSGISREDCQRLFFPFVQLGEQVPTRAGTGLGLAICKQYVELMGGQIGVASEPGKGSVFYFHIPVRVLPAAAEPEAPKHGRMVGLAEGQPCYRLLIAEDQPENRLLLRRLLEPLGFELREAVNGQEAVALFEQWHPDLIWMDIRMPVMDGLEAVRRIRATEVGADTKIIAITAHALEEERRPILAVGCDDLVRKPFREQEIFDTLARHLHLKFLYEKTPHANTPPETLGLALRPEQLAALPAPLRQELRQAVLELDTARTQTLIEQVTERDTALGRALYALATRLDYSSLLKLLDQGPSQTGETL